MLPIEDYDRLLLRELRVRVRTLPTTAVEQLLAHEERHAARPAVLALLHGRLDEATADSADGGPADGPALQDRDANPGDQDTALAVQHRIAQPPKAAR